MRVYIVSSHLLDDIAHLYGELRWLHIGQNNRPNLSKGISGAAVTNLVVSHTSGLGHLCQWPCR